MAATLQAAGHPPRLEGRALNEEEHQPTDGVSGSHAGELLDNRSGEWIDSDLVRASRKLEIDIIHQTGVWRVVQRPEGTHVVGTRWVDVDRGDRDGQQYRSRLVAQELCHGVVRDGFEYFADTPPMAALRRVLAFRATSRDPSADVEACWIGSGTLWTCRPWRRCA